MYDKHYILINRCHLPMENYFIAGTSLYLSLGIHWLIQIHFSFGRKKTKQNCANYSSTVIIADDTARFFQFYEIHKNKAYCVYCQYCLIHLQMGRVAQLQDVIKTRLGLSAIHWLWWTETQTKNKYYFISYIKFLQFIIIKKEAKNQVYHCFSSIILYFYKKYNNKSFFLSFFF